MFWTNICIFVFFLCVEKYSCWMGRRNIGNSKNFTFRYGSLFMHCDKWHSAKCVETDQSQCWLWVRELFVGFHFIRHSFFFIFLFAQFVLFFYSSVCITYITYLSMNVDDIDTFRLLFFLSFRFPSFHVLVPPMVWIPHQLVGIPLGYNVTLECFIEAHPISLNYWSKEDNEMIHDSIKYK